MTSASVVLRRGLGAAVAAVSGRGRHGKAERRRRAVFFDQAAELTPYLAVPLDGELLFVATADTDTGRKMFVRHSRGDVVGIGTALEILRDLGLALPRDPVFVDVGANVGATTVVALRRHGFSTAVALEPSPETFRLLRINLVANGLEDRVLALPVAASDRAGDLLLNVTKANPGRHQVVRAGAARPRRAVTVQAVTLDGLVADQTLDPERVGLLWIDAQKHDANVLVGASQLLTAGVPVVTAIRVAGRSKDPRRPWNVEPETKARVLELLSTHYSDVIWLHGRPRRKPAVHPIGELGTLVDSFRLDTDILLARR